MTLSEKVKYLRDAIYKMAHEDSLGDVVRTADEALERTKDKRVVVDVGPPSEVHPEVWSEWIEYRVRLGSCKNWDSLFRHQVKWLEEQFPSHREEILNQSMRQGWTGLFPLKDAALKSVNQKSSPAMDKMIALKELDRVEERMRIIKGGYSENMDWTQKDRDEMKRLKARRSELKQKLGMMV